MRMLPAFSLLHIRQMVRLPVTLQQQQELFNACLMMPFLQASVQLTNCSLLPTCPDLSSRGTDLLSNEIGALRRARIQLSQQRGYVRHWSIGGGACVLNLCLCIICLPQ